MTQKTDMLSPCDVAIEGRVTPATVRWWADRGLLPVQRTVGGRRLFRRDDVDHFLEARRASKDRAGAVQ